MLNKTKHKLNSMEFMEQGQQKAGICDFCDQLRPVHPAHNQADSDFCDRFDHVPFAYDMV